MKAFKSLLAIAVFALALSARAEEGGTVKGSVKYDGEPPAVKAHAVPAKDQPGCQCKEIDNESLVVDKATKGIQWAAIRIMGVKAEPPANPPALQVDQKGCKFSPHVVIVSPGANLDILNPDKIGHNFHTTPYDGTNSPINKMMLPTDEKMTVKGTKNLAEPEIIKMQCDIHPWMGGFIIVHDPRYAAISGKDGTFEIKNVPAGKYEVLINHELGEQKVTVEVKTGATADIGEIKFKQK